ncbi:uncharacterized protein BJX67DRAFT_176820 [Aspergillus lucknowensis]|uniref:Uncharacterized protein n=1 Tax=Aspergillus lucknowensis TaxID=176173 RepID=A0ABR4LLX7_9EURO
MKLQFRHSHVHSKTARLRRRNSGFGRRTLESTILCAIASGEESSRQLGGCDEGRGWRLDRLGPLGRRFDRHGRPQDSVTAVAAGSACLSTGTQR